MVMRQTAVTYVCDRCGEKFEFDGEKMSFELITQKLKKEGWRVIRVGSISGSGHDISRDLCRTCVERLSQHLDYPIPLP